MASPIPRPTATCHACADPLVATFHRPYFEFVCVRCGRWYTFLAPRPASPSEALDVRHEYLRRIWDAAIEDAPSWQAALADAQAQLASEDAS